MKRKHLKNVVGIVAGFSILIFGSVFALWQLDLIVSGPVWWGDATHGWSASSRYADQYFQCFLWKTTIGQAYDTLFLLTFLAPLLGLIIAFASVWFWEDEE